MPTLTRWAGRPRPQRDGRREHGQVLILFVMGATVIFVIGAIVVDIGLWVSQRRSAQAAADLAALAAATQLGDPVDPYGAASAKGLDFAQRNGYDRVLVRVPASNDQVTVEVKEEGPGLFSGIFGILGPEIGATATASYTESPPGPGWVLFANSANCSPGQTLDIEAEHLEVNGSTHSNGNLYIDGPQDDFTGPVTWVCPNGFTEGPQQHGTYQPNPYPISSQPIAVPATWGDIQTYCTSVPAGTQIENVPTLWSNNDPASKLLRSNVICSDGDLGLSGDGISGHVTFAAHGNITITSTGNVGNRLQPADSLAGTPAANLLVFSDAAEINITAAGGEYRGFIYAPLSQVIFNGSAFVEVTGSIVGDTVLISGNDFRLNAMPGLAGPPMPPEIHLED